MRLHLVLHRDHPRIMVAIYLFCSFALVYETVRYVTGPPKNWGSSGERR
jgi:hypothetical protein